MSVSAEGPLGEYPGKLLAADPPCLVKADFMSKTVGLVGSGLMWLLA